MSFYSNTRSKVRVISPEELFRMEFPLGDTFRLVYNESLDMTFRAKENVSDNHLRSTRAGNQISDKCMNCCFIGTCRYDPYHHLSLRCFPQNRADGKDILFERVDWVE